MKGLTSESMTPQTTIIGLVGILLFASGGLFFFTYLTEYQMDILL